ncbi:putative Zn finger-containing protein [Cryptosporidium canis]|uniref:Zn finger-containing protein n=1 Tax=Cryptosporidium canis TaxID=195482 RepID=A0ABQ8PA18_9CRYT|nr:putative Zn finger-containing protein [Cryptosporidium canis]KAJ1613299.1 putative Zn finger-containing protein [Cryptosporidium canis]
MNGGVYNIPPNLSDSLSKIDHPDWTLASAPKNPAANSPNSASESFNICHTNTSPSPSPPEQIPSQTSPPELNEQPPHGPASRPKTGFHAQSFPGHNEGLPIGPGNEFLLGSPNMLVPGFVAPPTLPPTSDGLSSPFTAPSGGVVPPFLRDNQGAEVPDYSVDCSPFSFLIGDLGEIGGAGIGATGFGMEFCFLNPWK